MRCFKTVIFIVLMLLARVACIAQVDSSQLLHFYLGKGMPSNNVYSFITDRQGYLWFATENGVVKYNGYTFRVFNTNDGLPVSDVYRLFEDTMGRIWLQSFASTIGYIRNDKYTSIKYNFTEKYATPNDIHQIGDKIVFEYVVGTGVRIAMITPDDKLVTIPSEKQVFSLYFSAEHEHFVHSIDKTKLYKVTAQKGWFHLKKVFDSKLNGQTLIMNRCFIAHNSLFYYQFKGNTILKADISNENTDKNKFYKSFNIAEVSNIKDEYIYLISYYSDRMVITAKYNVYVLDYDFNILKKINTSKFLPPNTQVSYTGIDKFGNMWLTSDFGVWMLPENHGIFSKYVYSDILQNAVPSAMLKDSTLTFREKNSGNLYFIDKANNFATNNSFKEQARYIQGNNKNDFIVSTLAQFQMYNNGVVKSIAAPEKSFKIQGGGSVSHYFPPHKRSSVFTLLDSIKDYSLETYTFHEYQPGQFFNVGASYLFTVSTDDTSVTQKVVLNEKYMNLLYDSVSRTYFVYNRYKLLLFDPYTAQTFSFNEEALKRIGVRSIYSIWLDKFRNLYIITDNKLLVYNLKQRTLKEVLTNVNLIGVKMCISNNKLVLCGNFGVAATKIIGPQSWGDFHYMHNPKNHNYNTVNYAYLLANENLIFGTDQGILTLNVDSVLNNSHLGIGHGDSLMIMNTPFMKNFKKEDTLIVEPDLNSYSLDLINFLGRGDRKYYYRIKGDMKWSESLLGEIPTKELEAGRYYTMECYAMDESWRSRIYTYYVYKKPYWWQTTFWLIIFWSLGIIGLISLIFFTAVLTRNYVSKANEKKSKLLDLELRALYSQINPHFIFNALSAALFFINKKKFEEAYLHVSKFSRLLRSYLKSSQERYVTLSEEINMLRTYIELQQTRFEEKFDYSIKVENKIPTDNIKIPSLLLQPLIENAIIHGLFHKQGLGFLKVQFLQGSSSDELICIIEDDGVGRIRASEIKRESSAKYDSYGTKLTQQLIEIFKEYEHMNIYLEYIDKQLPETGTIVKLTLRNLKFNA